MIPPHHFFSLHIHNFKPPLYISTMQIDTTNTQNTSMPLTPNQTTEPMAVPPPAKRPKPNPNPDPDQDQTLVHCPRCDSPRTKFCYYNNYSLSQPRYFCKSCRRYWTKGGTLRNVPVGGLSRRNKKPVVSVSVMQQHRRRGELQPQLTVQYDKLAVVSNGVAISPSSTSLKLSCPEPSFPLFDNSEFTFEDLATSFTERNCDSKDYEGGDYFSTLVATGGYGAVPSHIHEPDPFAETMSYYDAQYEKIMNGDYDVKPKLFENGCHLGLHGSSAERNGSSGLGLGPSWAGLASGFGCLSTNPPV